MLCKLLNVGIGSVQFYRTQASSYMLLVPSSPASPWRWFRVKEEELMAGLSMTRAFGSLIWDISSGPSWLQSPLGTDCTCPTAAPPSWLPCRAPQSASTYSFHPQSLFPGSHLDAKGTLASSGKSMLLSLTFM